MQMAVPVSKDLLRAQYVGKSLYQVATPTVVLDLAKVEANCNLMLETAERLNLSWRAHIKTHKVSMASYSITKGFQVEICIISCPQPPPTF